MSAEQVTVGCKIPMGAKLHLYQFIERDEPILGGGSKTVKFPMRDDKAQPVTLYGPAQPVDALPENRRVVIAGAAFTRVAKDFMEAWMEQNPRHPWLQNGLIFVAKNQADGQAIAKEEAERRSNQGPLNPLKDARNTSGRRGLAVTQHKRDPGDEGY